METHKHDGEMGGYVCVCRGGQEQVGEVGVTERLVEEEEVVTGRRLAGGRCGGRKRGKGGRNAGG